MIATSARPTSQTPPMSSLTPGWVAPGRAEQAGGLVELGVVVEDLLEQAEALRDHERAEGALERPEGDERAHARRGCRSGGEQREAGRAEEKQAAAAEDVAEPRAGDQQHGKGQGVAGAQPLDGAGAAAEVAVDGGGGDVDDRGVEQVHDVGGQHDGRHDPAQAVGLRARGSSDGGGVHEVLPSGDQREAGGGARSWYSVCHERRS
jgi:hypothetical protein